MRFYTALHLITTLLLLLLIGSQSAYAVDQFKRSTNPCFIPNKGQVALPDGQVAEAVKYYAKSKDFTIYFRKEGISYIFTEKATVLSDLSNFALTKNLGLASPEAEKANPGKLNGFRLDMDFARSSGDIQLKGGIKTQARFNYFYPHCPDGVTDVHGRKTITYQNVYEGIDIRFYFQNGHLKYDIQVQPQGHPENIKFNFKPKAAIDLNLKGNGLQVATPLDTLRETIPMAYQKRDGRNSKVACQYQITGGKQVLLEVGSGYNEQKPLTIDPLVRSWASLTGGRVNDVAVDENANVYLTGPINSNVQTVTFTPSAGAFQTSQKGSEDAFLSKFNANGSRDWATYYGGSSNSTAEEETGFSVAVKNGLVAFTGNTLNTDFPVTSGAYQTTKGGAFASGDAFLVAFDTVGNRKWATFFGGSAKEVGRDVAISQQGKIAITGETLSSDYPLTSNAFKSSYGCSACSYAFIAAFDTLGNLTYSSYFGGKKTDIGWGIDFNQKGELAIGGQTNSPNFRQLNSYQNTLKGKDAFISVFSKNLNFLKFSTLIGGNKEDKINSISFTGDQIYFGGFAEDSFPTTTNAYQATNPNQFGGFRPRTGVLGKVSTGGKLGWSTFFGASARDRILDIAFKDGKGLYFISSTLSFNDFPTTPSAFSENKNGTQIGFGKFSALGALQYASYYWGRANFFLGSGQRSGIAVANDGSVYFGAGTAFGDPSFFLENAYKEKKGDGIVAKFSKCIIDSLSANSLKPAQPCRFDSATFKADSGYNTYRWYQLGRNTFLDKDRTASFDTAGEYILRATTDSGCTAYDTVFVLPDSGVLKAPFITNTQTLSKSVVKVRWRTGIPRSVFQEYKLYRKRKGQSAFKLVDVINEYTDTVFNDSSVRQANSLPYTYYVTAGSRCGNRIFKSNTLSSMVLDTVRQSTDSITLAWNRPSDTFTGTYRFLNAHNGSPKRLGSTIDTTITVGRCQSSGLNQVTYARQSAVGKSNQQALMPTPPGNLKQVSVKDSRQITLEWSPFPAKSIAYGYIVERKEKSGGFKGLDTVFGRLDTTFQDSLSKTINRSRCYRVRPLDSCTRNASIPSDTHCTMYLTADTNGCQQVVALNWNAYEGFDSISQYQVYRKARGGTRKLLTTVKGSKTSYRDTVPSNQVSYAYEIVALAGNQGYRSTSNEATARVFSPKVPSLQSVSKVATGRNSGKVKITWENQQVQPKLAFQRLYYQSAGSRGFTLLADSIPLSQDTFVHENLDTKNKDYRYYLTTMDSCGNESDSSDRHKTINLSVKSGNLNNQLQWTPYRGFSVQDYQVQKSIEGGSFRNIATLNGSDTSLVDSNIRCGIDYNYKVLAEGREAVQSSISDTVSRTGVDTIPPDRPDLHRASVRATDTISGEVELLFGGAPQANRKGYVISRKQGNTFQPMDTILTARQTNLTYTATKLNTASTSQTFYVQTIDSCRNTSLPSDTHRTIALTATPKNAYVQLKWSAYQDWNDRTYQVQRRQSSAPWQKLTTLDSGQLSYRDSGVTCQEVYNYRIVGEEKGTSYQGRSNTDTAKAFETTPPAPPVIRTASVTQTSTSDGKVNINWNRSTSKDAAKYTIYRSPNGQDYQFLDTVTSTTYTDQGLNTYNQPYYYRLKAIDSCDNLSDSFSTPHRTINLEANGSEEAVILSWNEYKGRTVSQYQILRGSEVLYTVSGEQTFLRDEKVVCDTFYNYQVRALMEGDTSIQALSNTDSAKATDNTPPSPIYLQRASVTSFNDVVELKWQASEAYDAQAYQIYRRNENSGDFSQIAEVEHPNTTYQDSFPINNREVCYFVKVKDACGNSSEFSNRGCIIQPEGEALDLENELSWPPYQKWQKGTRTYEVFKQTGDSTYQSLTSLDSSQRSYLDQDLRDSADQFCYYIRAQGFGEETYSRSTRLCLEQSAVVYIPNTFTPASSFTVNDQFGPEGLYIDNYQMQIYNRWGEEVFSTSEGEKWDGTYNGELVPQGVYHYQIMVRSEDESRGTYQGRVTIIR